MKLFCRHEYVQIGRYDLEEMDGGDHIYPAVHLAYVMCTKCGKYREIPVHDWKIIQTRQWFREARQSNKEGKK